MNGNILSQLEEKDQEWYFLCKEIELFERFTICSAPPVGFVAKDGFGEFRDFGQFWRAADDFARLVMLPCALPQTDLLRRRIGIVYVSVHTLILIIVSSWFGILTPLPKSVCINKAGPAHSWQSWAYFIQIVHKSGKWGAAQKWSAFPREGMSW